MKTTSRGATLWLLAALALPCAARGQVVSGLVAEQLSLAPANGAVVVLLKVTEPDGLESVGVTTTDTSGAFSLTVPGEGVFRVQANLDGLASPLSRRMAFTAGAADVTDLALLLPSALLHLALGCQEEEEGAAVVGVVHDSDSDVPLPGALVTATWQDGRIVHRLEAGSDASGRYRICGLPVAAGSVRLQANLVGRSSPQSEVTIPGPSLLVHDIDISLSSNARAPKDVVAERILMEAAAWDLGDLHGQVRDRLSGTDLPYVVVRLLGTPHQALSDEKGHFVFEGLSPGSYTLEVQNLGYSVTSDPVEIPAGKDVNITFSVASQAVELEGLHVTTRSAAEQITRLTPFRRDIAYGDAMAEEEMRGAMAFEVLRRTSPGLRVTQRYGQGGTTLCVETNRRVQSLGARGCANVQVVVDGVRIPDGSDFLLYTSAAIIESIEFLSPVQAQIGYGIGGNTANGVVVVYTRGRGPYTSPLRNRSGSGG